jgi:hypothetical protein
MADKKVFTSRAIVLVTLLSSCCVTRGLRDQEAALVAKGTTAEERTRFKSELIEKTIEQGLTGNPIGDSGSKWEGAFWGMELARYTSERTTEAVRRGFGAFDSLSPSLQRALLEVTYALYPEEMSDEVVEVLQTTGSEKLFAMASLYLIRADAPRYLPMVRGRMQEGFPQWQSHPILVMLAHELHGRPRASDLRMPPIVDLLAHSFEKGKPVLFSIQREDRRFPGIAVLRDQDGKFVRRKDGEYFWISQLALSSSNLPGYLTNGNTPEGILSFQGFDISENRFIGPTENIQLVLPGEVPPQGFFHNSSLSDSIWTKELYRQLLPSSWKDYLPIWETFYSGAAGRTEIIAHGTTIDPSFYQGQPFFPNTPSLGCLTALESWSEQTGENVRSDQRALVELMKEMHFDNGYSVVVNLNGERRAVMLEDVSTLLAEAEKARQ